MYKLMLMLLLLGLLASGGYIISPTTTFVYNNTISCKILITTSVHVQLYHKQSTFDFGNN